MDFDHLEGKNLGLRFFLCLLLRWWGEGGRTDEAGLPFFTMYMCVDVCYEYVLLLLDNLVLRADGLQRRMRVCRGEEKRGGRRGLD